MQLNNNTDIERSQQLEEGQRLAREDGVSHSAIISHRPSISVRKDYQRPASTGSFAAKKSIPKGHEAFLKGLETSGASIFVERCSGDVLLGIVKHSDKYTISLRTVIQDAVVGDTARDIVLFKHDVSAFWSVSPRPVQEETV